MKAALVIMGVSLLGKQTFAHNNRGSFHLDERSGRMPKPSESSSEMAM